MHRVEFIQGTPVARNGLGTRNLSGGRIYVQRFANVSNSSIYSYAILYRNSTVEFRVSVWFTASGRVSLTIMCSIGCSYPVPIVAAPTNT